MSEFKDSNLLISEGKRIYMGSTAMTEENLIESLQVAINNRLVTSDSTADPGETLLVDASLGNVTIYVTPESDVYTTIKKIDSSSFLVKIRSVTGLIEGLETVTLENQYEYISITCDGTNWWVISGISPKPPTFKFQIENASPFTLPIAGGGASYNHNFTVNWGDGSPDSAITSYNDPAATHNYAAPGTYDITMTGVCEYFGFNDSGDKLQLIKLLEFTGDMGFKILNFWGCTNLTDIVPLGIKESLSSWEYIGLEVFAIFFNCSSLTSIPADLLVGTTSTNMNYIFGKCIGLTSIPEDLFKYNTAVTDFEGVLGMTGLTSIPIDLFKYNTAAENFGQAFFGCTGLTSIPADLFKYNLDVTLFDSTFGGCTGLTSIPADLFKYNTAVVNFSYIFSECSGLTSIPADLFRYNTLVTDFDGAFYMCASINTTLPGDLFLYNLVAVNFTDTFSECSNMVGLGQPIIDKTALPGHSTPTSTDGCFTNCTSLEDYDFIPVAWGGLGESSSSSSSSSSNSSSSSSSSSI